jgi:hypothetical protein
MRFSLSAGRAKAENIALFLIGISTVFIGNYFIYYFLTVNHPTHSHGYLIFGGVVFILAGIELIRPTYQIFIPLKKNNFESFD